MTQTLEIAATESTTPGASDLVAEIHRALARSEEPQTLSKIRAALPGKLRGVSLEELADCLRRQVAADVLYQYPRYRSQQDRFWDRPMKTHVAALLKAALGEQPLPLAELRRRLPAYALAQAEEVLDAQLLQGLLHRHPPASKRGHGRFGVAPADPKEYLRSELSALFTRLEPLGFTRAQLRAGALELLHEEEWASPSPAAPVTDPGLPEPATPPPLPVPGQAVAEATVIPPLSPGTPGERGRG